MLFGSDNVSGICPEIIQSIIAANGDVAASYGNDAITKRLDDRFQELFERNVKWFPVMSGTAANALSVAAACPPWGAVLCHESSHIAIDECGAPEFYTGGAKLITLGGHSARIDADALRESLAGFHRENPHEVQPAVLSLTQMNEFGVNYSLDHIGEMADIAHGHDIKVHLDGSRFANAVVALDCSAAEMTWRLGVDIMSFGASKNGAMCAEAVVFFDADLEKDFKYRHKRGGHLLAKMRFISAQLEAYILDDVWIRNARGGNRAAARLSRGLAAVPGVELEYPTDGNLVFVTFSAEVQNDLIARGYESFATAGVHRLATSFDTTDDQINGFIHAASGLHGLKKGV